MAVSNNLGMYLPTRDDYISVKRDISDNLALIDAAAGNMDIIVNGNTASVNVTSGQFVTVLNSTITGVTDGIYKAVANVAAGVPFVAANLTSPTSGALNELVEQIENQGTYGSSSDIKIGTFGSYTVYRKRFDLGSTSLANGAWTTKTVSLTNLITIIDARLLIWNGVTAYNYMNLPIYLNSTTLGIYNNLGGTINGYAYLIVDYAK